MSKLHYKAIIEDVQNEKCTDRELEILLDIFTRTVKKTAVTLARKAWFDLNDFSGAKENGLNGFSLTLEKHTKTGAEQWRGTFEKFGKRLKVLATLERD
ncbi:MAG: hypothetical protein V1721_09580 [Pseudomonadota bacterium]